MKKHLSSLTLALCIALTLLPVSALAAESIPPSGTAYAAEQTVLIDDQPVRFQTYMLLNAEGNGTNYIKLRDLAAALNGTAAQFEVGYDGSIVITTGKGYTAVGGEMTTPFSGNRPYTGGAVRLTVDGVSRELTALTLLDDSGLGYTYFKLRDLGAVLNFGVDWDTASRQVVLNTSGGTGTQGPAPDNSQSAMGRAMLDALNRDLGHYGSARLIDIDGDGVKELLVLGVEGYLAYLYDWKDGQLNAREVGADAGGPCIWWLFRDTATGELGVEYQSISEYEDTSTFYYAGRQAEIYYSFREGYGFDYRVDNKKVTQSEYDSARGQRQQLEWLLGDKDYSLYSISYKEEFLDKEFLSAEVRAELECLAAGKTSRDIPDETLWSIARRAVDEIETMEAYLVSGALLAFDQDNPIDASVVLGDEEIHIPAYRVLHYTKVAGAEKALRELWYHKFSSKYPSFDSYFERDCLAEYNDALYRIVHSMGFRPGYGVVSKMASRTADEVIFSGYWTYGDGPEDIYDFFELSLVYENGAWKYGYLKDK